MVKQQRDRHDCDRISSDLGEWQQNILTEATGLSRSIEKTERKLSQVDPIADNQKSNKAIAQVNKIGSRLASQEKQLKKCDRFSTS